MRLQVRRAPTWEQLLAFRQRVTYFSLVRRVRQCCCGWLLRKLPDHVGGVRLAEVSDSLVGGGGWAADTHQANPIVPSYHDR